MNRQPNPMPKREMLLRWHVASGLSPFIAVLILCRVTFATEPQSFRDCIDPRVFTPPRTYPHSSLDKGDIKAIFYEALAYKGNPTRVFAYVGVPKSEDGKKVPGMVLIHGGGGTAF